MEGRTETVERLAREIVSRSSQHTHPYRVAFDGRTASGKTTLANEIAATIGSVKPVLHLSIDGFHRPRAERYRQSRLSPQGYLDDSRDWNSIRDLMLHPLGADGDRRYRTRILDLETDTPVTQSPCFAEQNAIVLVDGTFLQRVELSGCFEFIVFVEVDAMTSMTRGVTRDSHFLGGDAAAHKVYKKRYLPAFEMYEQRFNPRDNADVLFNNKDIETAQLLWAKNLQSPHDYRCSAIGDSHDN